MESKSLIIAFLICFGIIETYGLGLGHGLNLHPYYGLGHGLGHGLGPLGHQGLGHGLGPLGHHGFGHGLGHHSLGSPLLKVPLIKPCGLPLPRKPIFYPIFKPLPIYTPYYSKLFKHKPLFSL